MKKKYAAIQKSYVPDREISSYKIRVYNTLEEALGLILGKLDFYHSYNEEDAKLVKTYLTNRGVFCSEYYSKDLFWITDSRKDFIQGEDYFQNLFRDPAESQIFTEIEFNDVIA